MNMSTTMTPWLHFGNADYLIFRTWHPSSHGTIAAACIAVFSFCILERCLAALRRTQELRWRAKTTLMARSSSGKKDSVELSREDHIPTRRRPVLRSTPSYDISRGAIHAIQSIFSYTLMLVVMTFNGAYILSIILGLGVGEVVFGRMGRKQEVE